eukprot:TRINITY_DN4700_c0_g6_i1.p1 TRINITY_DN4700_c0_g6~~TRINITY_DN4700_c0_g6_i1.p1  ORF type:complete len:258 (-),score=78.52 TRINITY_DN4700_c0_g6_i1:225-998(-)
MAGGEEATTLQVESGVATLTLNRPNERNSLGPELINSLGDNLKSCMSRDDVRVIVLTNAGGTFCAGANLKGGSGEAPRYTLVDIFKLMQEGSKVIVGRIAGHCTGGGVGLAAACDVSVASAAADLGFTEVRIGVSPAIISVVCLPKLRRGDAAELFLSGEKIQATRAAEMGLINYAVAAEQLDAKVADVVGKLLRGGPNALAATKALVYRVPGMPVDEAFNWTAEVSMRCFASPEAREGMKAFRNKTDAPWIPKAKL